METIIHLTPSFAVAGALVPEDFPKIARLGFLSVVSNRPDEEEVGQLTARDEAVFAWRSGLAFRHVPAGKHELFTDPVVEGMADALNGLEAPVLAHCKSGLRSVVLWSAASARSGPLEAVVEALRRAGFDPDALRLELEAQAHRKRWLGQGRALRCSDPTRSRGGGHHAADLLAQNREQLRREPRISLEPRVVAPRGMRHW